LTAASIYPFVPSEERDLFVSLLEKGRAGGVQSEMRLCDRHGALTPVYLSINAMSFQSGDCICLIVTDLTEQKRNEEIVADERLARSILENAAEAIVVCNTEGHILRVSQAAHRLCGQNPLLQPFAAMFPLEFDEQLLPAPPHARQQTTNGVGFPLANALRGETLVGVETRLCRADGQIVHLLVTAGPLRSVQEKIPGCVITLSDITEYKRAEETLRRNQAEIEALNIRLRRNVAETNHRVKNNLQVISALVELQAMNAENIVSISDLKRIGRHISTLSSLHNLLTQEAQGDGEMEVVSSHEAMQNLIPLIEAAAGGQRILADVEDICLPVKEGIAFSLLVNELVSNAIKHGVGDIHVSLVTLPSESPHAAPQALLQVSDHGPGFPDGFDPRQSANTGLDLVESLSRWDLNGQVVYENREGGGACVAVTFPIAGSTEAGALDHTT
jgi:two-component sensor histidine kinase/PAS domain-containing protein